MCEAGGFKLLRCQSNCRQLQPINGRWSVEILKTIIGQAKVFIRPIKKKLSTKPLEEVSENNTGIHEKCYQCEHFIAVCSLREHLKTCEENKIINDVECEDDSESTDHNTVDLQFNRPTVDNNLENNNGPQPNTQQKISTSRNTQNNVVVLSDGSLPVFSFLSQLSAETGSTIVIQDVIDSEEQKTDASETDDCCISQ
ncbi:unnamed protein product [Mytilus coruscus]|uniref:Uncharacterized protein n=1 Tax=Mytilus coruscus TaxID=42192 RepID=A0A6J8EN27_MYTCO|nr:unnamed protein product [Mytilus coruscus]